MSQSVSPIHLIFPKLQWQGREIVLTDWPTEALLPNSPWFCIGSCFAERSARALKQHLLPVHLGANAALYTPEAVWHWLQLCQLAGKESCATFCQEQRAFTYYDAANLRYLHPYSSGGFAHSSADQLCAQLWQLCNYEYHFLQQSKVVLVTLGSSFSFYSPEQGVYWSNGHKLPAQGTAAVLQRCLLPSREIERSLHEICILLKSIAPEAVPVVSVSPLRHDPLAAVDNSLSKAQLLCAAHQMRRENALYYFPAYEIVMDELRDYRWYDQQHKQLRIDSFALLLERLLQPLAGPQLRQYLEQVCQLVRMLRHKGRDAGPSWLAEAMRKDFSAEEKPAKHSNSNFQKTDCSSHSSQAEKLLLQLHKDYPEQELPESIAEYLELLQSYRLENYCY